jgi:hypothetical protein
VVGAAPRAVSAAQHREISCFTVLTLQPFATN